MAWYWQVILSIVVFDVFFAIVCGVVNFIVALKKRELINKFILNKNESVVKYNEKIGNNTKGS